MAYTETKVSGETLYKGKIISLHRDIVRLQNGKDTVREVVEHPGGVCILPVDSEGNILFVRQYRYPHKTELYELPAGKRDSAGGCPGESRRAPVTPPPWRRWSP